MKMRKILSLALASLFVLAVFVIPAMAGTKEIPVSKVIDPRDGATELDGTTDRLVIAKTQAIIYATEVGEGQAITNDMFVEGFNMAITYTIGVGTDDGNFNKPMSIRLMINEPDDVGYARDMAVYPDVYNSSYAVTDNGDGTYTINFTYDDLVKAYAETDTGRNKYKQDPVIDFATVLADTDLIAVFTRNIEADTKITKIEVTSPAIGGGAAAPAPAPSKNPQTGDNGLIVFAIVALLGSASAIFFLRKRVEA